jgi:hypothetical protein
VNFFYKIFKIGMVPTADASVDVNMQVMISITCAHPSQYLVCGHCPLVTAFDSANAVMGLLRAIYADTDTELRVLIQSQYLLDLLYNVLCLKSVCDYATSGCAAVRTQIGHKTV